MATTDESLPEHCVLEHQVFTAFAQALFRRAPSDGTPVMVIPMGGREALLPLRGLQREFAIADDSNDGRMLGLIAASLDFVAGLHIGDRLPAEILTGEASWEPTQQCRDLVKARLRRQLVAWADATGSAAPASPEALLRQDADPEFRRQAEAAFDRAAKVLGLLASQDVVRLVEALAEELAYIETLRASLLRREQGLAVRLGGHTQGLRGDRNRAEMLVQVQRLMKAATRQLGGKFDEIDARTGEIMAALGNIRQQQMFIRSRRDWLYRCQLAWDPVLRQWDHVRALPDEGIWQLIGTTYQFLAPRYMPVTEWQAYSSAGREQTAPMAKAMKW